MNAPLVTLANVHAGYGRSEVLFGVNLAIQAGSVVTLLGRNGMGKSTTVKTLLGSVRPTEGTISFKGQSLDSLMPDAIARLGIAVVPEGRRVYPNLTVREHLLAFARGGKDHPKWTLQSLYKMFPRLKERAENLGHQLSGGEQQMLAFARALSTHPELLVLDEATEGLAPVIRDEIWNAIRLLRDQGQTILLIDKHLDRMIEIADNHFILERGQIVWSGSSTNLKQSGGVCERYLGV